jgi:hypothetical protein
MNRDTAIEIQKHALDSIAELMEILRVSHGACSPDMYEKIKRGVGLSIGRIQMELLEIINHAYPDLDDLK